jgi:hypothetical protein
MEMLDGTLSRVMFHQPSKFDPAAAKYMIGRTAAGQTVKGSIENPVVGAQYRFWGEFKAQRNRDGEVAFEFDGYEPIVDASATGAETYLCDHVKGIGRAKAAALAEAFEGETLAILRETPERAKEVPGITDAIVDALRTHFDETRIDPAAYARLIDLFNRSGHKIPKKVVKQLLKDFRSDAPDKIKENPYLLLAYPGIGWATADSLAMTSLEYDPKGLGRHCAAMLEAIARVTNEGHTFATKPQIVAGVHSLIQQEPRWDAWHRLVTEGEIDGDGERYSTTRLWMSENVIASTLAKLATAALPLPCHLDNAGLAPDQAEALETIASSGVCLLVGPPGTGKSFTIARAIRGMRDGGVRSVKVMAPTGKAAKRAAELLRGAGIDTDDVPCTTIHRALGPVLSGSDPGVPGESAKSGRGRDGFEFIHGPGDPLDASVIVVDECFPAGTMVDTPDGPIDIAHIRPGQDILNAFGTDYIIAVRRTEVHRVVRLSISGKTIETSKGHPFFTARGIVNAGDLEPGDSIVTAGEAMRLLRDHHRVPFARPATLLLRCLQWAMVDGGPGTEGQDAQLRNLAQEWGWPTSLAAVWTPEGEGGNRAGCGLASNAQAGMPGEGVGIVEGHRSQAVHPGRKRERADQATSLAGRSAGRGMDDGVCRPAGRSVPRLSNKLQTGPGFAIASHRNRSGRIIAPHDQGQGTRCQEGCETGFARVDRVEVLQSSDPRLDQLRDADGKLHFYDLQAARHQSFSVEGLLVHNCSMVDVRLMQSLVVSIKPGTRVVFVGDENQLPSVGPGSTLRDMLGSGLPVARLRDIKRSDGGGRVVRACHAIKDGRTPEPAGQLALPTENWIHIEASDPATIAREVVNLYGLFKSVDPVWDVQTISAQKGRHAFGCDALNSLLADKLNPPPPGEPIDPNGQAPPFRVGDKVVRLKNGNADELRPIAKRDSWGDEWRWDGQAWDTSQTVCIVNGDLGEVLSMSPDDKGKTYVVVRFRDPDRLVRLPFAEHHLARAYALTVHKGQGSGWPVVIVPVHTAFYWDARTGTGLWCRELIYTAISRAEKALITVGQWAAVRTAIGRQTVHQRRTRLAPLLADAMAGRPVGFGLPALPGPPEPTAKVETANPYDFSEMMTDA